MKAPFLSVVIPVYNESQRLHSLTEIATFLKTQPFTFEIIVVNDGSSDDTLKKLKRIASTNINCQLISYKANQGKGFALKTGFLKASGQFRMFTDIDLSTPIAQLPRFLPFLSKYDVVIATRRKKGARLITRQPLLRENLGKGFTYLSRQLLNLNVSDFTCGFKFFSQTAAVNIFSRLTINRWGFDAESLFIAHHLGFKIKEVPVSWRHDRLSQVKFPQDLIRSFQELVKIRYNHLKKRY